MLKYKTRTKKTISAILVLMVSLISPAYPSTYYCDPGIFSLRVAIGNFSRPLEVMHSFLNTNSGGGVKDITDKFGNKGVAADRSG